MFQPVTVVNWELQVQLKIHGKGKDLFGDGMAIWYARERMKPGPVFGNVDFYEGLAIFIDTYSNHNGEHNVSVIDSIVNVIERLFSKSEKCKKLIASNQELPFEMRPYDYFFSKFES